MILINTRRFVILCKKVEEEYMPEQLTADDLDRVFIRAQVDGRYRSISAREATDQQFDEWAKSRVTIRGDAAPWDLAERADFCDRLYQQGALHILKKDVVIEDE
jgi:hypothetical protein